MNRKTSNSARGVKIFMTFVFVSVFFIDPTTAANYYVDNNYGNDLNTGLSPSAAWQTLTKVNSYAYSAGDSILFIRDGLWRGQLQPKSGSSLGYVTYAAYGIGAKPQLLGSVKVSDAADWINLGGNIWQSAATSIVDVGNLVFNNGVSCGKKKWTSANLLTQGDFWWDKTVTHKVEIYSAINPAAFYSDIEAALGNFIIYMSVDSFVVIQNFSLKYGAADGIEIRNTHHTFVRDCELSFIGGTELTTSVRYGGGIQFWANSHDNTVERCKIWEIYDDAVTNQGNVSAGGTVKQYNLFYINNLIWNCSESSFCYFIQPASINGSYMKNIRFENNTCNNAGGGWAASQRPDLKGFQIYCSENTAPSDSIFIRNNIFCKSRCVVFVDNSAVQTWSHTTSDYNCWYSQNNMDTIAAFWTPSSLAVFTEQQFSNYQTANNQDMHSFIADPLFVNPFANNYSITAVSPCKNTGTNTGIAADFNLTSRPQGVNYDIGAYEYFTAASVIEEYNVCDAVINIYPNPSSGIFTIYNSEQNTEIRIYNSVGAIIYKALGNNKQQTVDISTQPKGIYFVWSNNVDQKINIQKLIITKQ